MALSACLSVVQLSLSVVLSSNESKMYISHACCICSHNIMPFVRWLWICFFLFIVHIVIVVLAYRFVKRDDAFDEWCVDGVDDDTYVHIGNNRTKPKNSIYTEHISKLSDALFILLFFLSLSRLSERNTRLCQFDTLRIGK